MPMKVTLPATKARPNHNPSKLNHVWILILTLMLILVTPGRAYIESEFNLLEDSENSFLLDTYHDPEQSDDPDLDPLELHKGGPSPTKLLDDD